ncbi:MAG: hypothetical protein R3E68_22305 [Burkholderiaceae bacterium]
MGAIDCADLDAVQVLTVLREGVVADLDLELAPVLALTVLASSSMPTVKARGLPQVEKRQLTLGPSTSAAMAVELTASRAPDTASVIMLRCKIMLSPDFLEFQSKHHRPPGRGNAP